MNRIFRSCFRYSKSTYLPLVTLLIVTVLSFTQISFAQNTQLPQTIPNELTLRQKLRCAISPLLLFVPLPQYCEPQGFQDNQIPDIQPPQSNNTQPFSENTANTQISPQNSVPTSNTQQPQVIERVVYTLAPSSTNTDFITRQQLEERLLTLNLNNQGIVAPVYASYSNPPPNLSTTNYVDSRVSDSVSTLTSRILVLETSTSTGGSSQWDDVAGGISFMDGNVGVGTSTPASKLDIVGLNGGRATILQDVNGEYDSYRFLSKDTSLGYNGDILMSMNPEEGFYVNQGSASIALNDYDTTITGYTNIIKDSSYIKLFEYDGPTNSAIEMFVAAGDYDYETTLNISPEIGFDLVSGSISIYKTSTVDSINFSNNSTGAQYDFRAAGESRLAIHSGNVGIGTSTPTSKLTVEGEIFGTANMTLINEAGIFFPDSPAGFGVVGYGGVSDEFGILVDDGYVAVKKPGKFYYGTNNGSGVLL